MADPKTLFDLSGRVACVTGASSGLGQQAASALAAAGAQVIGVARRAEALSDWAERIGPNAATLSADLSQRSQIKEIAAQIASPFGAPDILVHAAGINTRETADTVTDEGWDITLNLNLAAPFFLSQAFVPDMKAKGWGRIVNFASLQSFRAFPGGIAYGATKGGVAQMTRAMAPYLFPIAVESAYQLRFGFLPFHNCNRQASVPHSYRFLNVYMLGKEDSPHLVFSILC